MNGLIICYTSRIILLNTIDMIYELSGIDHSESQLWPFTIEILIQNLYYKTCTTTSTRSATTVTLKKALQHIEASLNIFRDIVLKNKDISHIDSNCTIDRNCTIESNCIIGFQDKFPRLIEVIRALLTKHPISNGSVWAGELIVCRSFECSTY